MSDTFYNIVVTTIISTVCFWCGVWLGRNTQWKDKSVISSVEISTYTNRKYVYTTDQFDFISDSVYQVGDTIKITRY